MSQTTYCWRCQIEVPMLTEAEWSELAPLIRKVPDGIKAHRETTGDWPNADTAKEFERAALDRYEQLTGFHETNVNALWHHRLSLVGPPCARCGRPMRTKVARFCAACGHRPSNTSLERTLER